MNKLAAKRMYEQAGIQVPAYRAVYRKDKISAEELIAALGRPIVVKPLRGGSSIGMSIALSAGEVQTAIRLALEYDDTILLEQYIKGRELTCGVIGNDAMEALPIIEIVPGKEHAFFNFQAKYTSGEASEICPADISETIAERVRDYAVRAHQALFCRGYSRTDMILTDDEELFVLETNTIPGMTPNSLLPLAARTGGYAFDQLLDKLIELALEEHPRNA
jgi:D-alanine-D-alanine ligase